jgi:hypothetical protein
MTLPVAGVAAKQPKLPTYKPMTQLPASLTSEVQPKSALKSTTSAKSADGGSPDYAPLPGTTVTGLLYDDTQGYFTTNYTIAAVGQHIEVWVQNNLAFPAGDPRATPVVTAAQVAYLVDQFDNNIYPKESEFWRTPETRVGENNAVLTPGFWAPTDGKDRTIAMISNIRDANYYDPTFPVYIAGFYSPTIRDFMDRNVISIDAYDWGNRVGPPGSPWRPNDGTANDQNYLYEGTFAHEYQHLLHADQNSGEENWVNEGLSDWTEWLVGYGLPPGHWDTAQQYAENSLVVWGDQGQGTEILADYGEAFMFMHYLYGKYGERAMQALFQNQGFGIAGFNAALASLGINDNFADMYHDFAVARLVLANKGDYHINDIPSPVVLNSEAYSTPGAPPWGSDYLNVAKPKKVKSIDFNGVDLITRDTAWTAVADPLGTAGQVMWSGAGDEMDHWAVLPTTGGSTLTFDTLYDNEEQWDFGFVMVSTDDGATWHALTNADTRDDIVPDGYPAIKAVIADGGEGLTGYSGGWVNESFSLPAGTDLVAFRMMTDWGSNGNGVLDDPNWYVDNVRVDGTLIGDGSNPSAFKDVTFYHPIDVDFTVDLVSAPNLKTGNSAAKVYHLITDDATEQATESQIRQALRNSNVLVIVVTYDAQPGETDYAPYTVNVTY